MGPNGCSLEVMAPGLFERVDGDWAASPSRSRLERLLSRGCRADAPASTPLRNLLHRFGCDLAPGQAVPEGPLALLGDGIDPGAGFWFRATPVVLQPDRDQLMLFDLGESPPPQDMVDSIARRFNHHFEEQGWHLEVPQPLRWYLRSPRPLDVQTVQVQEVAGQGVGGRGPSGPGARILRQILTETEMLMHQLTTDSFGGQTHPFAANGLWVHGGGSLPRAGTARIDALDSADPLALGLAALCGVALLPAGLSGRTQDGVPGAGRVLSYSLHIEHARRRGDREAYLRAFDQISDTLCDLAGQLSGASCIQVTDGGPFNWYVDGRARRRWWRRTRPLAEIAS